MAGRESCSAEMQRGLQMQFVKVHLQVGLLIGRQRVLKCRMERDLHIGKVTWRKAGLLIGRQRVL